MKTTTRTFFFLLVLWAGKIEVFAQDNLPEGALNGLFSVSACQQVRFSQGNLQYLGNAETPCWRFAEHQWVFLADTTGQDSDSEGVARDLFGWGTSGYHDTDDPDNVNYQPWSVSQETVNPETNEFGYGPSIDIAPLGFLGGASNYDWGVHNAIVNGGGQPGLWRTLTHEEWDYLFHTRVTSSGLRYAKAQVHDVKGMILLPDDWNAGYCPLHYTNTVNALSNTNVITDSLWTTLEQHGAVFLPAAGLREETSLYDVGDFGFYWSSSSYDASAAYHLGFGDGTLDVGYYGVRYGGMSVRLVCQVQSCSYEINAVPDQPEGGIVTGAGMYPHAAPVTLTATPNPGYLFLHWTEDGTVLSDEAVYSFTATIDREASFVRAYTVSFNPGNGTCATASLTESGWQSGVILPSVTPSPACAAKGYTFQGWATWLVEETLVRPSLYQAGEVFYPSEDVTLFAVYAFQEDTEWVDVTDFADFVEGNYIIASKKGSQTFYLPCSGPTMEPSIPRMVLNEEGVPVTYLTCQPLAPDHLWTIAKINDTQYSISYQKDGVTYYLKAFADNNYGLMVSQYEPSSGWEIHQDATYGLLLRFPNWEPDPDRAVRYLSKTYSSWATLTLYTYVGIIHLYRCPTSTYTTYPDCPSDLSFQEISLDEGWNWFTPMMETSLVQLEEALGANGLSIQSQDASVTYADGQWTGTLDSLIAGHAYQIETSAPCAVTLSGYPVAYSAPAFAPGFNWFGYTGSNPVPLSEAFPGLTPSLGDKIISQDEGFAIFNGTTWEGTLTVLQPGQGYVYLWEVESGK